MTRVNTTPWATGQLTDGELTRERADLEHKLGDDAFTTAESRENWCARLTAIKNEQQERADARRPVKREAS